MLLNVPNTVYCRLSFKQLEITPYMHLNMYLKYFNKKYTAFVIDKIIVLFYL